MSDKGNQVAGVVVSEVLGWKLSDDKKLILVGIQDGAGGEFALAVAPENVFKIVTSLLSAVGQVHNQKGMQPKEVLSFGPDWFEVARIDGSDSLALSLYMPDKSALSFQLPKAMVENLSDVLAVTLGKASTGPTPGTIQH